MAQKNQNLFVGVILSIIFWSLLSGGLIAGISPNSPEKTPSENPQNDPNETPSEEQLDNLVASTTNNPSETTGPVKVVEPKPLKVVEPKPIKVVEPKPIKVVEPEPIKVVEPEPIKVVEPEPVKVVEPEPVKVVEPEPIKVVKTTPPKSTGGMVTIPSGSFLMGISSRKDNPPRTITLDAFEIDKTEVTVKAYQACTRAGGCSLPSCKASGVPRSGQPVVCVSWYQAKTYCEWAGKHLPTEAEWEKAARGATDRRIYPWGKDKQTCKHARYGRCGITSESAGARPKGASPYGVLGMSGNVSEWVEDAYQSQLDLSATTNPVPPKKGEGRVFRGSDFMSASRFSQVSWRRRKNPGLKSKSVGFRCAR